MKAVAYLKDVYSELIHKVTWPAWKQLQNSAVVVMVASVVIALIVWAMDTVFENLMKFLYNIL
ncbi:preprotein translocase subunit SecE [Balneicella halophila]|uniref:Protein translocase subunit SecE n=1 Tax=Balneicella halophila TaxID=1537566 RepID=A0A7L4UQ40_BALHA|nr:preprotein translocase subunit SecE [Balneicella halophila]PVX50926.1 preprotein translocase subunit SecE [Balneicella halophila]